MPDIAEVGFKVDTDGLKRGRAELEKFTSEAKKVDKATQENTRSQEEGRKATDSLGKEFTKLNSVLMRSSTRFAAGASASSSLTLMLKGTLRSVWRLSPAIAALGAVATGFYQLFSRGSAELRAHQTALILTGNAAGVTASQLMSMQRTLATNITTQGQAAKSLDVMAGNARVSSEELERFTGIAIEFSRVTGQAVDDVAMRFRSLADDPVAALLQLNDQMNFLTVDVYRQVKELEDQGRATEAARLAQDTYANAMAQQASQITQNLGWIERSWNAVKGAATSAWDAMLNIGRAADESSQLASLNAEIEKVRGRPLPDFVKASQLTALEKRRDALQGTVAAMEAEAKAGAKRQAQMQAEQRYQQGAARYELDRQGRIDQERVKIENLARAAGKSDAEIKKLLKNFDAENAPRGGSTRSATRTASTQRTDPLETAAKSMNDQLQRQASLTTKASEEERVLYELQHGRLVGLSGPRADELVALAKQIDQQRELTRLAEEEDRRRKQTASEAQGIIQQMRTEEEVVLESYARRRAVITQWAEDTGNDVSEIMQRIEAEKNNALWDLNKDYWDKWLEAAEKNLTDFDQIAGNVLTNFSEQFGNAFEKMIFDSNSLGEAVYNLASGMARSITNAVGQMIAQELALQAVRKITGKTALGGAAAAKVAEASATSVQAGLNAYASTAAIPITGPALAPAAAAAAIGATAPMVASISSMMAGALAGMAHDGIDSVPETGTWLLKKGERVTTSDTSARLDKVLERIDNRLSAANEGGGETRIVNVLDPSIVGDYLGTDSGERLIVNVMQRNRRAIGV